MTKNLALWLLPSLFLYISGCASMHDIHPQSTLLDPRTLLTASHEQSPIPSQWWTRYHDPQLNALIQTALAESPTLKQSQARIRAALAAAGLADSAPGPQLDFNASWSRQRPSASDWRAPPPLGGRYENLAQTLITLNYTLDLWGKYASLSQAARERLGVAQTEAADARNTLAIAVANQYFLWLDAQAQRHLLTQLRDNRTHYTHIINDRQQQGIERADNTALARAGQDTLHAELAQQDSRIAQLRHQLAALTGRGPQAWNTLIPHLLPPAGGIPLPTAPTIDVLSARPDVVSARLQVEAYRAEINAAQADFYPSISLSAFYGLTAIDANALLYTGNHTNSFTPSLTLPLFHAGALRAALGQKSAAYDEAVERYNQTLVDAARESADSFAALNAAQQSADASLRALQQQHHASRIANLRAEAGISSTLNALDATQRRLLQQRSNSSTQQSLLAAELSVIKALGAGFSAQSNDQADTRASDGVHHHE